MKQTSQIAFLRGSYVVVQPSNAERTNERGKKFHSVRRKIFFLLGWVENRAGRKTTTGLVLILGVETLACFEAPLDPFGAILRAVDQIAA